MHYTSCLDGIEGAAGFQVSAVSLGAPWPLLRLVTQHSVHEPGPPTFGHVASPAGWAVFRSVDAGGGMSPAGRGTISSTPFWTTPRSGSTTPSRSTCAPAGSGSDGRSRAPCSPGSRGR
ncbi:GAP1-N2 domain-containing protein [Actinokineospora sp. NPDC004072]